PEADVMPSYGDILEFFTATNLAEYQDKKPHSAIAALTKMGTLHWSEVALRFNKRFISGESQKSVTLSYIKAFVRDLGDHLDSLSPSELFVLFQAQGINRGEKEKFSRTFDALVDAIQSGVVDKSDLRCWADNNQVASIDDLLELGAELKAEATIEDKEQKLLERRSKKLMEEFPQQEGQSEIQASDLPALEPVKILKALDKAADIVDNSASDMDKVDFLKAKAAAKLWDACFQDEVTLISKLRAFPAVADSYSQEVQQAFIEEYEGARALPIPDNYAFCDLKGTARDPKLMQRLVAFRLKRDFRLLNLSGTGTGKTLSAIYAAQICGCRRLLISCPNGVIESWRRAFNSAFPSANLMIKPDGWELDNVVDGVNVVIVNHERFQDRFAQQLLGFCVNYQADMIVIDEIHQSKRRSSDKSSQRRKLMNEFIRISSNINTELRVLGLSATPVINNLYEGRSLLELIRQESIEDVHETVDLNSCMNLYQHFVVHGIRMNPGQLSRTKLIHQEIDATSLLPQIVWATKHGTYHDIEQLLVTPKMNSLKHSLERGVKTVIFVTYIKNTLRPIANWLSSNNYSFSVFTGDEKEAQEEGFRDSLDEFIRGNTEVLVASVQCAGTGVDGLQSVCNRAIFFQLPWTSTEFEQTIGRLDRDGTEFESVNVYLPMTEISLPNGERWSWCRSKLDRIESKRDIAKAAVDGEIPDAATLISPSEASKYWLNWLDKLEQQSQSTSTVTV
ncbi:MAG: helicase-related protein, partial [Rhodoluna sp.]